MLHNAPAWATELLVLGILALLVGLALVVLGNVLRARAERRA